MEKKGGPEAKQNEMPPKKVQSQTLEAPKVEDEEVRGMITEENKKDFDKAANLIQSRYRFKKHIESKKSEEEKFKQPEKYSEKSKRTKAEEVTVSPEKGNNIKKSDVEDGAENNDVKGMIKEENKEDLDKAANLRQSRYKPENLNQESGNTKKSPFTKK